MKTLAIAAGDSAVYSEAAMNHLKKGGRIVYLKLVAQDLPGRIHDFETRGIAKAKAQTFEELFQERQLLYHRYVQIVIDCTKKNHEAVAEEIIGRL